VPAFRRQGAADLTILIGMINLWNRLAIGLEYVRATDAGA
jgi:alkylhydroperoxidase family enzyme